MAGITETLRAHSLDAFKAGITAADPRAAVNRCLRVDETGTLHISLETPGSGHVLSRPWHAFHLIAVGKAACTMMSSARQSMANVAVAHAIAVTTEDNASTMAGVEVHAAGHPVPNAAGLDAANKIADIVSKAQSDELVLVLISGGGSALLPCPVADITLDDKIQTTQHLLACGADIHAINCVRKHLSRLKGGGLAKMAYPADLHALILSDVLDDDLSVIASGPSVADATTFADAITILKTHHCWESIPPTVRHHLERGQQGLYPETLKQNEAKALRSSHTLIGSNRLSLDAVRQQAEGLGYHTRLYSDQLCGEARDVGERLASHCQTLVQAGLDKPIAVVAGGETTVTVTGSGKGGRNQEMALAFALSAERLGLACDWSFLSGGTDGRDGPTDAAGGLVDAGSLSRMRTQNLDPVQALRHNDAYHALRASGDLIHTGATGTNVADLQIALLHP